MAVSTSPIAIDHLLTHGVADLIGGEELRTKLLAGKPLRIKLGADPTAPDLHLGHAVVLRKLREFQDLGHTAVLIVGDATALIGDPTGKSKTRPALTEDEISSNTKTYLAQVHKVLDVNKNFEIRHNSEWLSKLGFADVIKLAANFTVARIIEREDFAKRLGEGTEVSMHELLYPMMQAYDSVMISADVELGGTDQRFNNLAGRELQKKMGANPQAVMLMPLLVGLDGEKKMSKSLNNFVGLSDPAVTIYGKIMSIQDEQMWSYFNLATSIPAPDLMQIRNQVLDGSTHPRDAKMRLALEIVKQYYPAAIAQQAQEYFITTFQRHEAPTEMPELKLPAGATNILDLLVATKLTTSKSEARRLVEEGGVKVDNKTIDAIDAVIHLRTEPIVIQKGKRHFVRVYGE